MVKLYRFSEMQDRPPVHDEINGLALVIIQYDEEVSLFYGRCPHRGALMADGHLEGDRS